jgi:hypothetical protein
MRVNKIKDMTMTLENKVMDFKYEMEATGSIDGAVDLMKESPVLIMKLQYIILI